MKNSIVLLFLSVYLFSTTELAQLFKIPVLVHHYTEHKQYDDKLSIIDYLVHHYAGHEKDADWDTDMKLPFAQHINILQVTLWLPFSTVTLPTSAAYCIETDLPVFYLNKEIPPYNPSAIWQPPQSV
ncbi:MULTISPECIES: hypothetical protein [unclassified Sphingobacterium]|uniref:hypothetical protein n=1 Tax=unclassified Sphingobacterium TaxID=2609468 RepID=UPI0025E2780C|nr:MULTISPECIES: hypothetical protein [unclassified Sphingobacterium]